MENRSCCTEGRGRAREGAGGTRTTDQRERRQANSGVGAEVLGSADDDYDDDAPLHPFRPCPKWLGLGSTYQICNMTPRVLENEMEMSWKRAHTVPISAKKLVRGCEISSCACLTALPGSAWLLLNKICISFSRSL